MIQAKKRNVKSIQNHSSCFKKNMHIEQAMTSLPNGIYIVGGKKIFIR